MLGETQSDNSRYLSINQRYTGSHLLLGKRLVDGAKLHALKSRLLITRIDWKGTSCGKQRRDYKKNEGGFCHSFVCSTTSNIRDRKIEIDEKVATILCPMYI
jgi:hypothetical protein